MNAALVKHQSIINRSNSKLNVAQSRRKPRVCVCSAGGHPGNGGHGRCCYEVGRRRDGELLVGESRWPVGCLRMGEGMGTAYGHLLGREMLRLLSGSLGGWGVVSGCGRGL